MELENKLIEFLQVIKGIAESIKREALEKNNTKLQEQLKEILGGFKQELEKGNIARDELKNKLDESKGIKENKKSIESLEDKELEKKVDTFKDRAIKLAKDNNIQWTISKEYQPKHSKDNISSVLDDLLKKAKDKALEENRERSKKVKTVEQKKEKTQRRS